MKMHLQGCKHRQISKYKNKVKAMSKAIVPVSFTKVKIEDAFWRPKMEINRTVTIPAQYEQCKKTGRIDSFKLNWKEGMPNKPHYFWDSDVAKWIEAASYSLAIHPDGELDKRVDKVIKLIAGAQQPDGYLNVYFTICEPGNRFKNLGMWHELYCAGHMIEAGVAHYKATGKRSLLDVVCRYADYIDSVFGPADQAKRAGACGHEEIELALVKLYRATGEKRYLDLSGFLLNQRGQKPSIFLQEMERLTLQEAEINRIILGPPEKFNSEYCQDHLPVREQSEVTGHAVRAMYLYCAMADVAAQTGDKKLLAACERLWSDLCLRKMYVTGGIGPSGHNEGFTHGYDLPNQTAYAETCAAVGLVFWNHRMLQLTHDGRYADVMERALYNGTISGMTIDGTKFFYTNPLQSLGGVQRVDWFGCACCPPNLSRMIASVGEYVYSQGDDEAYVNLYVQGEGELNLGGRKVVIRQKTAYPWNEKVKIAVMPESPMEFTLALRIPGWCRKAKISINGKNFSLHGAVEKGYARIKRVWAKTDRLELTLAMPVERVMARPDVRQDLGRVALQRGPVVYCLEEADNGKGLDEIALPKISALRARYDKNLLGGVAILTGIGRRIDRATWGDAALYRSSASRRDKPVVVKAIPYYAWANRGAGEMLVWVRET